VLASTDEILVKSKTGSDEPVFFAFDFYLRTLNAHRNRAVELITSIVLPTFALCGSVDFFESGLI